MKKVISIVLSLLMLVTMMSVGFTAQAAGKSSVYKFCAIYELDENGKRVIIPKDGSYFDSFTTIYNYFDEASQTLYIKGKGKIPYAYLGLGYDEDYPEECYALNDEITGKIKHIVIEEGITDIEDYAFRILLNSCETISLPRSVKHIGKEAFCALASLQYVSFKSGLEVIGNDAFSYCSKLKALDLPDTLIKFGSIEGCDELISIRFPNSLKEGVGAIQSCNSLEELDFPAGVRHYQGGSIASMCRSLKVVIDRGYPKNMGIYDGYINNCPNLKEVYITQKVNKKFDWANCKSDKYVEAHEREYGIDNEVYGCPHPFGSAESDVTLYVYSGNYDFIKYAKWRKINYRLLDAPKAVTKLKAAKVTANSIKLTWKESKNATFYKVQRYYYGKKKWETLANVKGTSYTVEKISSASTYKFRVKPVNKTKATYEAGKYAYVNATTKPAMTKNVKVKKSAGKLKVSYSKVKNATDYQIYIKTGENGEYKKAGTTTKTTFTTAKLKKGKTYYVKVRARKKVSKGKYTYGAYSKEVKVKI